MASFTQYVEAEVDVEIDEFYDELNDSEKDELIGLLKEDKKLKLSDLIEYKLQEVQEKEVKELLFSIFNYKPDLYKVLSEEVKYYDNFK